MPTATLANVMIWSVPFLSPFAFAGVGLCAAKGLTGVASVLVVALVALIVLQAYVAGMEFGRPHLLLRQVRLEVCISLACVGPSTSVQSLIYHFGFSNVLRLLWSVINAIIATAVVAGFASRTAYTILGVSALVLGFGHFVVTPPTEAPVWLPFGNFVLACTLFTANFLCYRKEQNTVALLGFVCTTSCAGGAFAMDAAQRSKGILYFLVSLLWAYLLQLWMRKHRQLPPGLRGSKFVTLSYLRKLVASGETITRCQELPPEAFGDFSKARYLVVISHRWLNRHACDHEGLRLRTMVDKLDAFFSPRGMGMGQGLGGRWRRFVQSLCGGRDVIVFFDFMALPQVGRDSNGDLLPRTEEETNLFGRVLPHMGTLYSTFPVMICDEVQEGVATYRESGWCFCELCIAWLGGQLQTYSSGNPIVSAIGESGHADSIDSFLDYVAKEIEAKAFYFDSDRDTVRSIVRRFSHKRALVEAIGGRDAARLSETLKTLKAEGSEDLLDQPVDVSLNTPLHLAVQWGFKAGVEQLVDGGATVGPRNLYGDTAIQFFMWPRLSAAAMAARRRRRARGGDGGESGNEGQEEWGVRDGGAAQSEAESHGPDAQVERDEEDAFFTI